MHSTRTCQTHCPTPTSGDWLPSSLQVIYVLAYALAWLVRRVAAPVALILALWLSGAEILPRAVPRTYARRVHVAARITLTTLSLLVLVYGPTLVLLPTLSVLLAVAGTAAITRRRHAHVVLADKPRGVIRVKAHRRMPVAAIESGDGIRLRDRMAGRGSYV